MGTGSPGTAVGRKRSDVGNERHSVIRNMGTGSPSMRWAGREVMWAMKGTQRLEILGQAAQACGGQEEK
jgi:hypothetical protein